MKNQIINVQINKILFINSYIKNCGVYSYGKRLFDILLNEKQTQFEYIELKNHIEYINKVDISLYYAIIYNYHNATMPWLNINTIKYHKRNIIIPHESICNFGNMIIDINPINKNSIPRPLFINTNTISTSSWSNTKFVEFINYQLNDVPIIGTFGFATGNKRFKDIVKYVNRDYDKAIIKFIISMPFTISQKNDVRDIIIDIMDEECKPDIEILFYTEFVTDDQILFFLSNNNVNIFIYDISLGRGPSSVIDYALSVNTPLCINNSYMFNHIYNEDIDININSIQSIINKNYLLDKYRLLWSPNNLVKQLNHIISSI